MKSNISNKNLENKLEIYIKEAYLQKEYLRCNNLMRLMIKINHKNKILLKYVNKIDESMLIHERKKWAWWFCWIDIFKSPKLYISIAFIYVLGKI